MSLMDRDMNKRTVDGVAGQMGAAPRRRLRIDVDGLKRRWFRDAKGERTTLPREFQEIKRPLLDAALGRGMPALANGRRIMVTSALPREGKTFCSINLALSIAAERDHGVVLVDADVARPSVPRELGVRTDRGLIDCLLDDSLSPAEVVCGTNIKRFSILPAGIRHRNATELLSSAAMSRFLDRLSRLYPDEIIVFDSPPLMVTSESRVLASHMGQIVLVVAAGETPRDVVNEAIGKLGSTAIAGVVLNKMSANRRAGYYGLY